MAAQTHEYSAEVLWQCGSDDFLSNRYSRRHLLRFDGGLKVPGSSSPHVVPLPMSDAAALDPEEAFMASLSSCHMLWFLSLAGKYRFCVDCYFDAAIGVMAKNAGGKIVMTMVTLRPDVTFSGERQPTPAEQDRLQPCSARGLLYCQFGQDRRALRAGVPASLIDLLFN